MKNEYYLRIKNTRIKRGLSVKELSQKAGISIKFLYDIENGKKGCSAEVLLKIATVLNVSCDFLMTGSNDSNDRLMESIKVLSSKEQEAVEKIIIAITGLRDS